MLVCSHLPVLACKMYDPRGFDELSQLGTWPRAQVASTADFSARNECPSGLVAAMIAHLTSPSILSAGARAASTPPPPFIFAEYQHAKQSWARISIGTSIRPGRAVKHSKSTRFPSPKLGVFTPQFPGIAVANQSDTVRQRRGLEASKFEANSVRSVTRSVIPGDEAITTQPLSRSRAVQKSAG
jgi:hypothetical protein